GSLPFDVIAEAWINVPCEPVSGPLGAQMVAVGEILEHQLTGRGRPGQPDRLRAGDTGFAAQVHRGDAVGAGVGVADDNQSPGSGGSSTLRLHPVPLQISSLCAGRRARTEVVDQARPEVLL